MFALRNAMHNLAARAWLYSVDLRSVGGKYSIMYVVYNEINMNVRVEW